MISYLGRLNAYEKFGKFIHFENRPHYNIVMRNFKKSRFQQFFTIKIRPKYYRLIVILMCLEKDS